MTNWISVKEKLPPKNQKFLFHYYQGIGIGEWGTSFDIINNNSERAGDKYILVLDPIEINNNDTAFQWDEEHMINMNVSWMPLPAPPKDGEL